MDEGGLLGAAASRHLPATLAALSRPRGPGCCRWCFALLFLNAKAAVPNLWHQGPVLP